MVNFLYKCLKIVINTQIVVVFLPFFLNVPRFKTILTLRINSNYGSFVHKWSFKIL
jgi:hypothetical protein